MREEKKGCGCQTWLPKERGREEGAGEMWGGEGERRRERWNAAEGFGEGRKNERKGKEGRGKGEMTK